MSKYLIRPSETSRRFNCPYSFILEKEVPKEEEQSEFAALGTLAHDYCAKALEAYFTVGDVKAALVCDTVLYAHEEHEDLLTEEDSAEMYTHVRNYYRLIRAVEAKVGGFDQQWVETTVEFNEHMGGTADFAALYNYNTKFVIADLKYGQGVSVVAEDNYQLLAYLLCNIRTHKINISDLESATMIIYQPRARDGEGDIRHWTIGQEDIIRFEKEYEGKVKHCVAVVNREVPATGFPGDHCLWCRAKPVCKIFKEDIKKRGVIALEKSDNFLPAVDKLTPEQIADAMHVKDRILEFYRALEPYVISQIEKGTKFPRLKVIASKTNRRWIDDTDRVVDGLKVLGVEKPLVDKPKLIGIGIAEKLVGKGKITHLTMKPPGKPKLVREDDARAEIHLDNPLDMLDDNVAFEEF